MTVTEPLTHLAEERRAPSSSSTPLPASLTDALRTG